MKSVEEIEQHCDTLAKAGSEHAHQRALFQRLNYSAYVNEHPLARMAYAIPNGGKRDKITAARLKAEGVKAGVPDVHFPVTNSQHLTLYIELKIPGNSASSSQSEWHLDLRRCGHAVATCWGWRAAWRCFLDYVNGRPVAEEYR